MIFSPKEQETKNDRFLFGSVCHITADASICKPIFCELWRGFCAQSSEASFSQGASCRIEIGNAPQIARPKSGFVLQIDADGVAIAASDEKNLIYGFFSLVERIRPLSTEPGAEQFAVPCGRLADDADVKVRMVHFCIFPETPLAFVQKVFRLAAFLRYTHLVVEFWGMLQFDCLRALGWPNAYSKQQLRPLFDEARALGVEIVPMFNHWGHAAASRVRTGKHVVLDQDPTLAPMFTTTGWEWDCQNPKVVELHRAIRNELIDLCGPGSYFHIGCDEAYLDYSEEMFLSIIDYINFVEQDLRAQGRKTILWGDMLLDREPLSGSGNNRYSAHCPSPQIQKKLLDRLSHTVVIADWQYNTTEPPLKSAHFFREQGFPVLCCPWDDEKNYLLAVSTVKEEGLLGVMHTTWHTLFTERGMRAMAYCAARSFGECTFHPIHGYQGCEVGGILRKLAPKAERYELCGWNARQVWDDLS